MNLALKRAFKIGMYAILAFVALGVSMVVGNKKSYGVHSTATGVPLTFADAPGGSCGNGSSAGEGGSGSGEGGSGSCGVGGEGGSGSGSGSGSGGSSGE